MSRQTLGDACSRLSSGKSIKAAEIEQSGSYPVMGGNGLRGYTGTFNFDGECAVIGRQGAACGNVRFHSGKAYMTEHAVVAVANSENDSHYLSYLLSTMDLGRLSGQSAQPGLSVKTLSKQEIDLPPLEEQKQVVEVLGTLDAKIETNAKLNGYLLECMKAQYHHYFCRDDMKLGSIYDIANVIYGAAFKSALFNEEKTGYPLIRIRDLCSFSPQYWTDEAHPKRTFVQPGDVLAGMDAEFTPCFWQGETGVLNQRVCLFEPAENSGVTRSYLLMALRPLLGYIQNYASGTTVAHMGKSDLEALDVPIPPQERLVRFNAVAEPMREQVVQNSIESRDLAALRDALLPKLMSGEIDVSEVDLTQLNSHLGKLSSILEVQHRCIKKTDRAVIRIHVRVFIKKTLYAGLDTAKELVKVKVDLPRHNPSCANCIFADMVTTAL